MVIFSENPRISFPVNMSPKVPAFNTVSMFYPDEEKQRIYLTSEV